MGVSSLFLFSPCRRLAGDGLSKKKFAYSTRLARHEDVFAFCYFAANFFLALSLRLFASCCRNSSTIVSTAFFLPDLLFKSSEDILSAGMSSGLCFTLIIFLGSFRSRAQAISRSSYRLFPMGVSVPFELTRNSRFIRSISAAGASISRGNFPMMSFLLRDEAAVLLDTSTRNPTPHRRCSKAGHGTPLCF